MAAMAAPVHLRQKIVETGSKSRGFGRESEQWLTRSCSRWSVVLGEVEVAGNSSRKKRGREEEVDGVAVLGLLGLVLAVEEEEGGVVVLLVRSTWTEELQGGSATAALSLSGSGTAGRTGQRGEEKRGNGGRKGVAAERKP